MPIILSLTTRRLRRRESARRARRKRIKDKPVRRTHFPMTHLVLVFVLSVGMVSFVAARFEGDPAAERFNTELVLQNIELPAPTVATPAEPTERPAPAEPLAAIDAPPAPAPRPLLARATLPESDSAIATAAAPGLQAATITASFESTEAGSVASQAAPPEPVYHTYVEQVRQGDNLSRIFARQGLSPTVLHRLTHSGPLARRLTHIFPGHELTFLLDDYGELVRLDYSPGPLETLRFERDGTTFTGQALSREPDRVPTYKQGVIDHSLFVASQRAGLDDDVTMRLAQIFQWDIDFVLDIRKGDEFHVLFEELYLGSDFIGYGDILAAEFVNQKDTHQALLYIDEQDERRYYNPAGESMRKAFLRAPVSFTRISSNFNLRRKHPLFKTTMPHRGIDYAAPTGTPVMAAGDGRIVTATSNRASGNYIVVQHGEQFVTKYLHLSKFARGTRKGARVRQGQVIGYVGRTGWATGPHLHYEFLVNGTHRNPRTVELPDAQPVPGQERDRFLSQTGPHLALLQSFRQQQQIAALE